MDLTTSLNGVTITATNANATYQWLDCDNGYAIIPGATSQSFTPSITTTSYYAVELNVNGCVDTSSCVEVNYIGIAENELIKELTIYPNPTEGNLQVDLGKSYADINIALTDLTGRLIHETAFQNKSALELNLNSLNGVYLLNINADQRTASKKLIVK